MEYTAPSWAYQGIRLVELYILEQGIGRKLLEVSFASSTGPRAPRDYRPLLPLRRRRSSLSRPLGLQARGEHPSFHAPSLVRLVAVGHATVVSPMQSTSSLDSR
jgi:hypothetical protein